MTFFIDMTALTPLSKLKVNENGKQSRLYREKNATVKNTPICKILRELSKCSKGNRSRQYKANKEEFRAHAGAQQYQF